MAKFIITGGQKLSGEIQVFGAKNSAIIMIAASCLFDGKITLDNVPDILDIQKIIDILEKLGVKFSRKRHRLVIDTCNLKPQNPEPALVGAIRASIVLVGPLVARFGKLTIPHPGGCTIGSRPIDRHIRAFQDLGVKVTEKNGFYQFRYDILNTARSANKVSFEKISVTATENILLFASLLEKNTTIHNAAVEPEILDLIEFLQKAGVKISQRGRIINILGRKKLKPVTHRVIPDRIEAGTFAILAATAKTALKISHIIPEHIQALLDKFEAMNIPFVKDKDFLYIKKPASPNWRIRATEISTAEYPGFPTDLQPPMGVLLTQASGKSNISENVFEHRLEYLKELQKMGANINIFSEKRAEINGSTKLYGAQIESLDIRAGATLLIAGLVAQGLTKINHAENIDRGYEKIEERLVRIGARVQRVL